MKRIRTEIANGLTIKAVLLSYKESEMNFFDNTFTRTSLFYAQNKLCEKVTTFRYYPENNSKEVLSYTITTICEYCVIPEADKMFQA